MPRVLLDTNILIYREDDRVISQTTRDLLSVLQRTQAEMLIHPMSLEDLQRDRDEKRRAIILSKAGTYPVLEAAPDPLNDVQFLASIDVEGRTSRTLGVDEAILYAVYRDAVDFLITEDRGIHRMARRLGIHDRVLVSEDAIRVFERYLVKSPGISPPALKEDYVYNVNVNDPIFDSLRQDYPEFRDWFRTISRQGRKCFVHWRPDGNVGAVLIYKIENEPIDSVPPIDKGRRIKLSTFKVAHEGHKIGELFLKLAVDVAIKNDIWEVYLTHFTEPGDRLVELISEYGFNKVSVKSSGENVYLKKLLIDAESRARLSPLEIAKLYYPSFYDGNDVRKFVVPIRPQYHARLFTDFPGRQLTIAESAGEFITEGNTIKKAYICHSRTRKVRSGDLILFYISGRKKLTSIGVVESIYMDLQATDQILRRVGRRTVYFLNEIAEMAAKPTTVILFTHHFHMKHQLGLEELVEIGALSGPPQSITRIDSRSYSVIRSRSGIDERFTVH
jgi:rRNA-processing protein FCF1